MGWSGNHLLVGGGKAVRNLKSHEMLQEIYITIDPKKKEEKKEKKNEKRKVCFCSVIQNNTLS